MLSLFYNTIPFNRHAVSLICTQRKAICGGCLFVRQPARQEKKGN